MLSTPSVRVLSQHGGVPEYYIVQGRDTVYLGNQFPLFLRNLGTVHPAMRCRTRIPEEWSPQLFCATV